jgi:alpha-1,6-mannosyltransferase
VSAGQFPPSARRQQWLQLGSLAALRPWQTNLALLVIGCFLVYFTHDMINENDGYIIGFSGASSASLALYLAAILIFLCKPSNVNRYTFGIILGVAIAGRLVTLFPDPFLSSDVYRYAWDGVVQHAGINPYRYVPGDKALTFLRDPNSDLFANMNRRDYAHTIYPPVAQIFFFLVTTLNASVTMMKLAMILCEGATLWGLVILLRSMGLRREWTLLYAWFPMLIWEIGGSGHVDSLVMAFLTFALVFRFRRQPALTGLFLGMAVLTKFYPLVLFPALYQRRADGKLDWKMPAVMISLAAATYSIYLSVGMGVFGFFGGYVKEEGMETGQRFFLLEWLQHLPGFHDVPEKAFLVFAALVLGSLSVWAWQAASPYDSPRAEFLRPAFALGAALMLLFSPHYPWYVAWLVPFFVLLPSLPAITYIGGLFYLCTTSLAVGSGPEQFKLNEILYTAIIVASIVEVVLRNVPQTRHWFTRRTDFPVTDAFPTRSR